MVEAGLDRLAGKTAPQDAGLSEHARKRPRARRLRRERLRTQGRRAERPTRTALAENRESFGKLRRNFPHYLSTLSPPFAASKNSEREASRHRASAPAPTRLPAPLSASLPRSVLFPGSSPRSFVFAPKGPPPGRRFLQADFIAHRRLFSRKCRATKKGGRIAPSALQGMSLSDGGRRPFNARSLDHQSREAASSTTSKASITSPTLMSWKLSRPTPHSRLRTTSRASSLRRLREAILPV